MSLILSLFTLAAYIRLPESLSARLLLSLIWIIYLILIGVLFYKWRNYPSQITPNRRILILVGAIFAIFFALFFGVRFSITSSALPPPNLPIETNTKISAIFAAIPWMILAGLLGVIPSMIVAFLGSIGLMIYATHDIFTPLHFSLFALLFSVATHQRYRTTVYKWLRHPLVITLLLALLSSLLVFCTTPFLVDGSLATRLDYSLTNLPDNVISIAMMLLIGGIVSEIIFLVFPTSWGSHGALLPSPAEKSLEARFFYLFAPTVTILTILLMAVVWHTAENAARKMIFDRLANTARVSCDAIPYFLESGQNMLIKISQDPQLLSDDTAQINAQLKQYTRMVPFFTDLFLLDKQGEPITSYPATSYDRANTLIEEQMGIKLALSGVPFQVYSAPPKPNHDSAQVSFITNIKNEQGEIARVLIGRTDLSSNPMTASILANLRTLSQDGGEGILLDENGLILFHPKAEMIMDKYSGNLEISDHLQDDTHSNGSRWLVYTTEASGRPWKIVLSLPASQAQQIAINITTPILIVILFIILGATIYFRTQLRKIINSLDLLAQQASGIALGQLNRPVERRGEDEEGRLRDAFEMMRISLKSRLDELNRLLWVSQGIASSLDLGQAVRPVLESALSTGAASARVVIMPSVLPTFDQQENQAITFADGYSAQVYASLDNQILNACQQLERIVLTNPYRPRLFRYPPNEPVPESLIAVALKQENEYFGVFWLAFDIPHAFSDEEIRFITTIAGQTSLAIANTRHYLQAEIGRKRLEAILESTPDPIFVTDPKGGVQLANPAALRALTGGKEYISSARQLHLPPALQELIQTATAEPRFAELLLPDGKVYSASASLVFSDNRPVNRVCVMKDITYFKELDTLKSEFVANVSHDLRSPLTLMRGYATMLEMVGSLNEQQVNYVRKIATSVESMTRLINNLLDLGRIEAGVGLQVERISVYELVPKVVGDLQLQATQKRINLSYSLASENFPPIEADQALLYQAIHNLLDNAIKFTDSGGEVKLNVSLKENQLIFAVQDNGIGIAPLDQPRLFEKFYRVKRPDGFPSGSGLGLAIVKSVAERHGGKVWVESQLGRGSIFYLAIPLRHSAGDSTEE
ncbi:MAG: ATP-binding protein [Anaerolineales bacterium]